MPEKPAVSELEALTTTDKPANRMILIGAPEWVRGVIARLHTLGFAEAGIWSRLTPTRNPGEVISVIKRQRV